MKINIKVKKMTVAIVKENDEIQILELSVFGSTRPNNETVKKYLENNGITHKKFSLLNTTVYTHTTTLSDEILKELLENTENENEIEQTELEL